MRPLTFKPINGLSTHIALDSSSSGFSPEFILVNFYLKIYLGEDGVRVTPLGEVLEVVYISRICRILFDI